MWRGQRNRRVAKRTDIRLWLATVATYNIKMIRIMTQSKKVVFSFITNHNNYYKISVNYSHNNA